MNQSGSAVQEIGSGCDRGRAGKVGYVNENWMQFRHPSFDCLDAAIAIPIKMSSHNYKATATDAEDEFSFALSLFRIG